MGDSYIPGVSNTITRLDDGNSVKTLGAFAQTSYTPIEKLILVAGLGLEKNLEYDMLRINGGGAVSSADYEEQKGTFKQENIAVFPRLAAIYSVNSDHSFKLMYGEAINSPSFQQNWTQFVFETYGSTLST